MANRRESSEKAAHGLSEMADDAREAAAHKLAELRANLNEYYEQGLSRGRHLEADFEQSIRNRPLLAVLISAAVGAGLGACIASFFRNRS